jgi:hypothetical protein
MKIQRAHELYWQIGAQARTAGLVSAEELRVICRLGARKCGYWCRHLLDLCGVVRDRVQDSAWLVQLSAVESEVLQK